MPTTTHTTVSEVIAKALPGGWFSGPPEVSIDDDEILIVGPLSGVDAEAPEDEDRARIAAFREETRSARVEVARDLEHTFGRRVSWGATSRKTRALFTTVSTPVMTRLRFDERRVLDTLIAGGAARSRSDAVAWCVRLVAKNEAAWLADLREALVKVQAVRQEGPRSGA